MYLKYNLSFVEINLVKTADVFPKFRKITTENFLRAY